MCVQSVQNSFNTVTCHHLNFDNWVEGGVNFALIKEIAIFPRWKLYKILNMLWKIVTFSQHKYLTNGGQTWRTPFPLFI